jgi:hypothetical protein
MGWRMLVFYPELGSDMSKSTNTVVYFDWKTVFYIYINSYLFIINTHQNITNDSGAGTISSSGAHVHPRFFRV